MFEFPEHYDVIPDILSDIQIKENKNLEYGVYTINVKIGNDNDENVRVIVMPKFIGILDENDNLIHIFSEMYVIDEEEEQIKEDDYEIVDDCDDDEFINRIICDETIEKRFFDNEKESCGKERLGLRPLIIPKIN